MDNILCKAKEYISLADFGDVDNLIALGFDFVFDVVYIIGIKADNDFEVTGHGRLLAGNHTINIVACIGNNASQLLNNSYFVYHIKGKAGFAISQAHNINKGFEYISLGNNTYYSPHAANNWQTAEALVVHNQSCFLNSGCIWQGYYLLGHDFGYSHFVQQAHDFKFGKRGGWGRSYPHYITIANNAN